MYYREARRVVYPVEEEGATLRWGGEGAQEYMRLPALPADEVEAEAPEADAPPTYDELDAEETTRAK